MSGPSLPPELVRIIVENLSCNRPDLQALTLVSKTFHWEAMRLLYRAMTDPEGTRHYNFLVALRKRPELAGLVHTYHVPTIAHSQKRPFWSLLLRCLLLMVNLKELVYHSLFAVPLTPFPQVKKGRKMPFQLDTFIWTVNSDVRHFHPTKTLQFLETQHELRCLRWMYQPFPITPGIAPNLRVLEGLPTMLLAVLPVRPVTDLRWLDFGNFGFELRGLPAIILRLKEFSRLRAVSLPRSIWSSLLSDSQVGAQVSPLNTIKVLALRSVPHTRWVLPIPSLFPCLKRLIIAPDAPPNSERYSETHILSLYESCDNLVYVDVWVNDVLYKRWINKIPSTNMEAISHSKLLELE